MIYLITGLPGNSKTLYTIAWVKDWAERENRPVYYSGIPELKLDWHEVEPEKWMQCPPRSIIVIDECQRVFRNRSINSQPPKFVTDLETHRHLGVDLVFITQHPMLIDPAVRRLTGSHKHLVRIWGMEASTVHEWPVVRENCDKPAGRRDSDKAKWKFDKSVYGLYKSAEVHTMKRSIPMRVKLFVLVPLLLAAAGWYMYSFIVKRTHAAAGPAAVPSGAASPGAKPSGFIPVSAPMNGKPELDPVADAKHFAFAETPRITGLAHTAPKYDDITKPTTAPVPAACVMSKDRCLCYTQQGTRMDVNPGVCEDIVHNGYFQDFDPDAARVKTERSVAVLDRSSPLPMSGASTADRPFVGTLGDGSGYGVLGSRPSSQAAQVAPTTPAVARHPA